MPTIDDLSQTSDVSETDEIALYVRGQGTRKATVNQIAARVLQTILGTPDETVYSMTTDGSSFTVAVLPATPGGSCWAQITLSIPAPAGTIILPGADDRAGGQEVLVTCTQTVTALTINGNGAALSGAPTTTGPAAPFRMKYDLISNTWYRSI